MTQINDCQVQHFKAFEKTILKVYKYSMLLSSVLEQGFTEATELSDPETWCLQY